MSSDEENFNLNVSDSGSESEGYLPVKKKKPIAAKTAPKSSSKNVKNTTAKSRPAKKVLEEIDENVDESIQDIIPAREDSDDVVPTTIAPGPARSKKSASETYQKLSQLEHILKRPDSYIGSVENIKQTMWVFDSETKRMAQREISYVPGFFKIVDEILVNAADNKINDPNMDTLKVTIDSNEGIISVYNNGKGIPIEIHSKEKIYIPEMIFGHLLTSSNYDDDEKKLTGGRNGYGAKLTNIYSTEFTVETADKNSQQKYKQTWTDNMTKAGKAKITKNARKEEYTKITFKPDLKRFGMDSIDEDAISLLKKRVYDMSGTVKNVKVYLNDERLKIKNFKSYVDLYVESVAAETAESGGGAAMSKPTVIYEQVHERWEVAFAVSDGSFQHVSFANSISTTKGGTHVDYIVNQISKNLLAGIAKKNKGAAVKASQIRNHMWIFVNALIENPTFDSQTKEQLTLPANKFGTRPNLSEDFFKKVAKTQIVENILDWAKHKADLQIKKTDGAKRNRLTGLPKLSDANNAGTRLSSQCTLILTEGDSAKGLAVAGLGVVGRDNFGVFPLRGKLLNVREAKHDTIMKNEEIQNVKKILGLQHNKVYSDISSLRYGKLCLMTDQDYDGSHIKGLLINFLDHFYPSLLKIPEFLVEFITPILRVTKGERSRLFYTIPEYNHWLETYPDAKSWKAKYFKGLGTSKDEDGEKYFSSMEKHMIPFATMEDEDRNLIDLAFSKKKADDRKEWLREYIPGTHLEHDTDEIPISDFINKELILFSMADNIRSIPSVADGLKPGQRKVIWSTFKKKIKDELKVAQLAGYISEQAAYHHGEVSLFSTIVNMAQDFVGSNNINLLLPNGQYGTREDGGRSHAAARYIYTAPSILSRVIFHPTDDAIVGNLEEEGKIIEPQFYMPVLPMILVNGAEGIGTGWSTNIPAYNPVDIVTNLKRLMKGEEMVPMLPWWRGFRGNVRKVGEHKYETVGSATKVDDTTIRITELPIHKWTQSMKIDLEQLIGEKNDGPVKDYKEYHTNNTVDFLVTMSPAGMAKAEAAGFEEFFKLVSKVSTSNLICFDFDGKIKKYNSAEEVIEDFYPVRLAYYQKRKDYLVNQLQTEHERLSNQSRFIQMIIRKELVVSNRKKAAIVEDLRKHDFRAFPKVVKVKVVGADDDQENEGNDDEDAEFPENSTDFDYLLKMAIWNLTQEKVEKLLAQCKLKEEELLELVAKTPMDIWNVDLEAFLEHWESDLQEWEAKKMKGGKGNSSKRKQATLKTRKSLTGGKKKKNLEDDSGDDFQPSKAAAKSAPKKTAPSRPLASLKGEDKKYTLDPDEDDDMVVDVPKAPLTKPGTSNLSKPTLKSTKQKVEADSDVDFDVVPTITEKEKRKPAVKKRKSSPIDDDSDDDMFLKPVKKSKTQQASLATFFDKEDKKSEKGGKAVAKAAPRPRVVSGRKPPSKKKTLESDDDGGPAVEGDSDAVVEKRDPPPRRAARAAPKKYIEIDSDEDGGGNDDVYELSD